MGDATDVSSFAILLFSRPPPPPPAARPLFLRFPTRYPGWRLFWIRLRRALEYWNLWSRATLPCPTVTAHGRGAFPALPSWCGDVVWLDKIPRFVVTHCLHTPVIRHYTTPHTTPLPTAYPGIAYLVENHITAYLPGRGGGSLRNMLFAVV